MFWDKVKKAWREVKAEIVAPVVDPVGATDGPIIPPDKMELGDDEEIRHEPVYDNVTGVESMQPVLRKKSEIG